MPTKIDPTVTPASAKAKHCASPGIISSRARLPTTEHERPMVIEDVGEGVVLVHPYIPPALRFLFFLMAAVGEGLRPRRRVSDRVR
jgi:hypothetical protein